MPELTPQLSAHLLYEYCISSNKKVGESVHNLFIIAEHYSSGTLGDLDNPEVINGIPVFFKTLSTEEKAAYCYHQVIEALSAEATPVTVESLRATKRQDADDPWSSYAGRFVRRVTRYVVFTLVFMVFLYFLFYVHLGFLALGTGTELTEGAALQWIALGCIGALIHLLNHALTATRLKTFELSEARKIGPRILLGGMFGFVVPWLLTSAGLSTETAAPAAPIAAFFGGYSVRFSMELLERLLSAILPETDPRA